MQLSKKLLSPFSIYLTIISLIGVILVAWGILLFPSFENKLNFFLFLLLAAVSGLVTTSVPVSAKAGVTYDIQNAISMAAFPFYGPAGATLIIAAAMFSMWLVKPADKATWKKSRQQLAFNIGMHSLAMVAAGFLFAWFRNLFGVSTLLGETIPWLLSAIIYDQLNLGMIIGVLRLQHGKKVSPMNMWLENRWAIPINILVTSLGAGILAFSAQRFDWIGVIVFFLPVILSSFAFRLYVRQMQAHMDNLEAIVDERTQALAQLMKEKDSFLAVLSHDMKTPLTSINIYASLIRDHPNLVAEKPHMAGTILRSQRTLTDIVNNILDLEKLQADGSMPLEKEDMDLAVLIESVVEPLKAQASQKQIDLQYEIDARSLLVSADRRQIKRVLQNLISNAIKYTPEEGRVYVHAYKNDGVIVTDVKDNGFGIPVDELPHVFDRFRRVVKHKSLAAGTGLGLAIAKAIMEAHGGTIAVESEEDKGSIFTIRLPVFSPISP